LNTENPVVKHYFLDPDAEAFLIVDVLKSASITVTASDDHGSSVVIDVPAIQKLIGTNVTVKANAARNDTLTYSGVVPVSFGFIVDRIVFDGTKWSLSGEAPSGNRAFGSDVDGEAQSSTLPILLGMGCRVSM
jgi:hypothetical protein